MDFDGYRDDIIYLGVTCSASLLRHHLKPFTDECHSKAYAWIGDSYDYEGNVVEAVRAYLRSLLSAYANHESMQCSKHFELYGKLRDTVANATPEDVRSWICDVADGVYAVEHNKREAEAWLKLAIKLGSQGAKRRLAELEALPDLSEEARVKL